MGGINFDFIVMDKQDAWRNKNICLWIAYDDENNVVDKEFLIGIMYKHHGTDTPGRFLSAFFGGFSMLNRTAVIKFINKKYAADCVAKFPEIRTVINDSGAFLSIFISYLLNLPSFQKHLLRKPIFY